MRVDTFLSTLMVVALGASLASGQIFTTGDRGNVEVIPGTEDITVGPGMVIEGVHLDYADLGGLDLTGSRIDTACMARGNLAGTLLVEANVTIGIADILTMPNADFSDGSFSAWIMSGDLRRANFSGAELDLQLDNTNASGAIFEGVDFRNSSFFNVNFTDANLRDTNWVGSWLWSGRFENADFTGAVIHGSGWSRSDEQRGVFRVTNEQLVSTASYQGKNLSDVKLSIDSFNTVVDFTDFDLRDAWVYAFRANYKGADLRDATISFPGRSDFSDAIINGTDLGYTMTKEQVYSTASYKDKNLRRADFCFRIPDESPGFPDAVDFSGANFRDQDLRGACFSRIDLTGADFTGAIYDQHTRFSGGVPTGAIFRRSSAGDVNLDGNVDFQDFLTVSKNYGERCNGKQHCLAVGDLNSNNRVDFPDFLILSEAYRATSAVAVPEPADNDCEVILLLVGVLASRRRILNARRLC